MRTRSVLMISLAAACAGVSHADITVDAFTDQFRPGVGDAARLVAVKGGTETDAVSQSGLAGVLGGKRTALLTSTGGTNGPSFKSTAFSGGGSLAVTDAPGANSFVRILYGNNTALNFDFSVLGPGGSFVFNNVNNYDQQTLAATLTLTSNTVTTQFKSINIPLRPFNDVADYSIPFSAFDQIDFTDVDVIQIRFESDGAGNNWNMGSFTAVPSPAASLLFGGGALLRARRRRD